MPNARQELDDRITEVMQDAIVRHWDELSPLVLACAIQGRYSTVDNWRITDSVQGAMTRALEIAVNKSAEEFAPVFEQLAREKTVRRLRKQLEMKGLTTALLDSIAEKQT